MLSGLWKYRYVVHTYVRTNLHMRYRRSHLGFIWVVLTPVLQYAVIGTVLAVLSGSALRGNVPYYLAGSVFFSLFSGILNAAPTIMLQNEGFIKKMPLPKFIYVVNVAGLEIAVFTLSAGALLLAALVFQAVPLSPALLMVPFASALFAIFAVGIACVISVANVYFRDIRHMVPVGLQALFFLTPAVYRESLLPPAMQAFLPYNPLYSFLRMFRDPILTGHLPEPQYVAIAAAMAAISIFAGVAILQHFDNRIVFRL